MSRGLGKWERLILAEVEASGFAWVGAVADNADGSLSARQAAGRAAVTLGGKGLASVWTYHHGGRGWYRTLVMPHGQEPDGRPYGYIKAVNDYGTPELIDALRTGKIKDRDAELLSTLPEDHQRMIDYTDRDQLREARWCANNMK